MAIPFIGDIIGGVIDIGKRLVPDRAANDAAKATQAQRQQEIEGALHQKQVEQIGKAEDYASAWNLAQANAAQTSWKDEYWTIVLSIPMIGAFVPGFAPYIKTGFDNIAEMPSWYQAAFGVAISAAFGFQQLNKAFSWWQKP